MSLITNANAIAFLIYLIPTCPSKVLIILFRSAEKPRPISITFDEKSMLAQVCDDIKHPNLKRGHTLIGMMLRHIFLFETKP